MITAEIGIAFGLGYFAGVLFTMLVVVWLMKEATQAGSDVTTQTGDELIEENA